MVGSRNQDDLLIAQAPQQMWQQTLGVKVGIASVEFKVWLAALRTKSFAITADAWSMAFNDPAEMLALAVTADPNNDAGWSDPRYDAAFALVNTAPTDAARREAMIACEKLIVEEVPYAPPSSSPPAPNSSTPPSAAGTPTPSNASTGPPSPSTPQNDSQGRAHPRP